MTVMEILMPMPGETGILPQSGGNIYTVKTDLTMVMVFLSFCLMVQRAIGLRTVCLLHSAVNHGEMMWSAHQDFKKNGNNIFWLWTITLFRPVTVTRPIII